MGRAVESIRPTGRASEFGEFNQSLSRWYFTLNENVEMTSLSERHSKEFCFALDELFL